MKTRIFAASIALLSLFACAGTPNRAPMDIESFSLINTVQAGSTIDKVVYHPSSQTLYALSTKTQEIQIFHNDKRKNVLGGLGTGSSNFQNLSDLGLARDGSLLALDSAARSIKKFSSEGKALGIIELKNTTQPTHLAVLGDQSIFVYDQASSEIICISALDGAEQYRFGKFELEQVTALNCNHDYVVAYDSHSDSSQIFSVLGQFVKSDKGQTLFDDYNNGINLGSGALTSQMSAALLPLKEPTGLMSLSSDVISMVLGEEIRLLKIGYRQVQ